MAWHPEPGAEGAAHSSVRGPLAGRLRMVEAERFVEVLQRRCSVRT
jgi:hypothetical protein